MISLNKVILIGNLVGDIEVKHGKNSGVAYTRFTIASNGHRNQQGHSKTNYASCLAFGKMAESLGQIGKKGNLVYVDGHIRTDKYTNAAHKNVYTMNVQVDSFENIKGTHANQTQQSQNNSSINDNSNTNNNYQQNNHQSSQPQTPINNQTQTNPTNFNQYNDDSTNPKENKSQEVTGKQAKEKLESGSKDINISSDKLPF